LGPARECEMAFGEHRVNSWEEDRTDEFVK
jgi:hypothetical protein